MKKYFDPILLALLWCFGPFVLAACTAPSQDDVDASAARQIKNKDRCIEVGQSLGLESEAYYDEQSLHCRLHDTEGRDGRSHVGYFLGSDELRAITRYLAIKEDLKKKLGKSDE